jgi:hypothetical protein
MKMETKIKILLACVVAVAIPVIAELTASDNSWNGKNNFEAPVDFRSDLRVAGSNGATFAMTNKMSGYTNVTVFVKGVAISYTMEGALP